MRKCFKYGIRVLVICLLSMIGVSCEKIEYKLSSDDGVDIVSITLGKEFDEFQKMHLSGEVPIYFGIQVYAKQCNGKGGYWPYAYGIFSQPDDISLKLLEGKEYRFECLIIQDGEDHVYVNDVGHGWIRMGQYPFNCCLLSNQFKYDGDYCLNISKPFVSLQGHEYENTNIENSDIVMFYGALDAITDSDQTSLEVPMYCVGYGLTVRTEELLYGSLSVTRLHNQVENQNHDEVDEYNKYFKKMIFTEDGQHCHVYNECLYSVWDDPNWEDKMMEYEKNGAILFEYSDENGELRNFKKNVTFKRNVNTILTVKNNITSGISIAISLDDDSLSDDIEYIVF